MRILSFLVSGTTIKQDPECDLSGLFPGKNDDVQAKFTFSNEWKSRPKVIAFWSMLNQEYPPCVLNADNTCKIPKEALARPAFKIQVIGSDRGRRCETDTITVYQKGGKS